TTLFVGGALLGRSLLGEDRARLLLDERIERACGRRSPSSTTFPQCGQCMAPRSLPRVTDKSGTLGRCGLCFALCSVSGGSPSRAREAATREHPISASAAGSTGPRRSRSTS